MLDWLIVGGGMQGTIAANFMLAKDGAARDHLKIIDQEPELLSNWKRHTQVVGMDYLRSTCVHHTDPDPYSLKRFAKANKMQSQFTMPYERPSLALFHKHTECVVEKNRLAELKLTGSVQRICRKSSHYEIVSSQGFLTCHNIVLALSATNQPSMPVWALSLDNSSANCQHVFAREFDEVKVLNADSIAIVGGGISAYQLAMKYARLKPGCVTLISRHAPVVHQFDSDPCWIGQCLSGFYKLSCPGARRKMITSARNRGSLPSDVWSSFKKVEKANQLTFKRANITAAEVKNSRILLSLRTNEDAQNSQNIEQVEFDAVVFATGFESNCPAAKLIHQIKHELDLPLSPCGFPLLNEDLSWGENKSNIYAIGPLAELSIGPAARNIIGARQAASRLICHV